MVDRYKPTVHEVNATVRMGAHPCGDYVSAADYDALAARARELEAALHEIADFSEQFSMGVEDAVSRMYKVNQIADTALALCGAEHG
jgi:hypothetical protein